MRREALVVGINRYRSPLSSLNAPAADAGAIAQLLRQYSDFNVTTIPGLNAAGQIAQVEVLKKRLKQAISNLFNPDTDNPANIPDAALLFFSGHGLRDTEGRTSEGFLATSDVDMNADRWGVSLRWLRDLLWESPVKQQIVWLDCCYSGEFMNFMEDLKQANPGNREHRDRCFIAASLDYKVAYETGGRGILTAALLQALDPGRREDGVVTNLTLTLAVEELLRRGNQPPICTNFGNTITLTSLRQEDHQTLRRDGSSDHCPYKGLDPFGFNDTDPQYFYGRRLLTDKLLEKVRTGNFLAVVGPSGSGKSSVVQAGLLHDLQQGERLSGSQNWRIYLCRPGKEPLSSLSKALIPQEMPEVTVDRRLHLIQGLKQDGSEYLATFITALTADRVVLVIDQFEECFTLCNNPLERQQFFACLVGAVDRLDSQLCVVITMRADFFNKCLEYRQLAQKIQDNLVMVTPMDAEELQEAITKPAEQLGVDVQPELVTQMIRDVEHSPGSLPLLQYTLQQLWEQRTVNLLTISAYNRLGGIQRTLKDHADATYNSLKTDEEKAIARYIFLELIQPGKGTEDTRRQVPKRELITDTNARSQALVESVIQTLADARLIVTSDLAEKSAGNSAEAAHSEAIDLAHEALIHHWTLLQQWIEASRVALKQKRDIEDAAEEWFEQGQRKDRAYLLQGSKLRTAKEFLATQSSTLPLSQQAKDFIRASQHHQQMRRWTIGGTAAGVILLLTGAAAFTWNRATQERYAQVRQDAVRGQAHPELWPATCQLRQQADSLKTSNVAEALKDYRDILTFTDLLNKKMHSRKQTQECPGIKLVHSDFYQDTEKALVDLIKDQRLNKLRSQLEDSQRTGNFGNKNSDSTITFAKLDQQFLEGPLRTTYAILINANLDQDKGVQADLNNDGTLNNDAEASRMPCETLQEIEDLWRRYTQQRCGWLGSPDGYTQPACKELDGQSLMASVLNNYSIAVEYAIPRLQQCGISGRNSASKHSNSSQPHASSGR
jgi:energy-coupling factor transporter ATP-binding protein EcfA2